MLLYPSIKEVKQMFRYNITKPLSIKIIKAFIIGSEAKGNTTNESDLDIAIVIKKKRTKSSLKFTEQYHCYFTNEAQKPKWKKRIVDFQFFYEDDEELDKIKKIEI
jgi:predicted nucleotidyltransferase